MKPAPHSPGPWTVEGVNGNLIYAPDGWIADVRGGTKGSHGETAKANARLIASAPTMHRLLVTLANMTTPFDGLTKRDAMHTDMALAERSDETLCSDADALYRIIEQARIMLEASSSQK